MQEALLIDKKTDEPAEHIPYSVGRQYVMNWRNTQTSDSADFQPKENSEADIVTDSAEITEDISEIITVEHSPRIADSRAYPRTVSQRTDLRLVICLATAVAGIIIGAVIALAFPLEEASLSLSVAADVGGGFPGIISRRLIQVGGFLLAEYILGYFAAGGLLVWLAPLGYGLGTGLSAAGICISGENLWLLIPCAVYTVVIAFAACASGEFSALLVRLVSGRGEVFTSGGSSSYQYTLRFGVYLLIILAAAIAETAGKLASV